MKAGQGAPERRVVAGYNEDDCRATLALRDWLGERRAELAGRLAEDLPRPAVPGKPGTTEDPQVARIRSALLAGVPAEPDKRTDAERAGVLLADLLDWHRREDKPAWWRYFHVRNLSPAELTGEPAALGVLTGGAGAHLERPRDDAPGRRAAARPDLPDAPGSVAFTSETFYDGSCTAPSSPTARRYVWPGRPAST